MLKLNGKTKVLCVAPHPDDVEYSMSHFIRKYPKVPFDIALISTGGYGDHTNGPGRVEECKQFWELAGVKNVTITKEFAIPVAMLEERQHSKLVSLMESTVSEFKITDYSVVFSPSPFDTHQDHIFVYEVVKALGRDKDFTHVCYKSPSTTRNWMGNYFVGLDDIEMNTKIDLLRTAFPSQVDGKYFDADLLRLFHRDFLASKKTDKRFHEQFMIEEMYV